MNVRRTLISSVTIAVAFVGPFASAQDPPRKVEVPNKDVGVKPAPTVTPNVARAPQPALVPKPQDPARVRATYEINGARIPITEGEFYDAQTRLEKLEAKTSGRPLDKNRVYEHILAFAEAKALGLEASAEEVALFDPLEKNKELAAATWARYEKDGITKEMYSTFQKELRSIQKVKDLFVNNQRVLSSNIFDNYRRDHFSVRLEFVEFPASKYADELRQKPPTDEELKAWWAEDRGVQNRFLKQSTITAEFVSFDPQATTQTAESDRQVTREEALAYYTMNKARLDTLLTAEQRTALYPTGKVAVTEIRTPFQLLRPVIDREIRLSQKIRSAFEQAKKPGADFAAIAAASGLAYAKLENVDREKMTKEYPRFGPQVFSILSNHAAGDLSPDLKVEPQIQYFYRLISKEASRLPELSEIKAQLIDPYIDATSMKRAMMAAQALRTAIDAKVNTEAAGEEEKIVGDAKTAAEAEIKSRGVTDAKEMESVKARHLAAAQAKVKSFKDGLASKHFTEIVKEQGLKLRDTGLFESFTAKRNDGNDRLLLFIKTNPQVRTMETGQVTSVLTDAGTKTQVVARMAERSEPSFSSVSDGELLTMRSQTERAISYQPVQRWQYMEISKRRDLQEK